MTADRAEWTGVAIAVLLHVLLIGALSLSLAHVARPPEPPSMEVDFVDEAAVQSAAPQAVAQPAPTPPAPQPPAPTVSPPPDQPPPVVERPRPLPSLRPAPVPMVRPSPPRPVARPVAPRRPGLDDNFLNSLDDDLAPRAGASRPAAARFDARAKASVAALFQRMVQPCANRQVNPGDGANRIRVTLNIRLRRDGRLAGTPQVVRVSGVDDDNARFEERVRDLAVAVYRECAPFSGLPPELYATADGGWSNINLTYKLP